MIINDPLLATLKRALGIEDQDQDDDEVEQVDAQGARLRAALGATPSGPASPALSLTASAAQIAARYPGFEVSSERFL